MNLALGKTNIFLRGNPPCCFNEFDYQYAINQKGDILFLNRCNSDYFNFLCRRAMNHDAGLKDSFDTDVAKALT